MSHLHSHFKDEINWLFFQLTRKNNDACIKNIETRLHDTLTLLKTKVATSNEFVPYLKILYRFIGFTRDNYKGIGEKTLSHVILYVFFNVFPVLGIYALHRLVKVSSEVGPQYYFGCWKDMKQICIYAYNHSSMGENHSIIHYIVRIVNTQLSHDAETWKFSANCFSKTHISNVAKYIPREKSNHGWLFEKLAIDWIQHSKPYILTTATNTDSRARAILKSKRMYRKVVSSLNKCLDTTETRLCNHDHNQLDLQAISLLTAVNKEPTFLNINSSCEDTRIAADFKQLALHNGQHSVSKFECGQSYSKISIYHIIKFAIRLYETDKDTVKDSDIAIVNKLWNDMYLNTIKTCKKNMIIPLLDVSYGMNDENLYSAIGISILLSHTSNLYKRIVAVDKLPTWIDLSTCDNIVDQVGQVMTCIKSMYNTRPNFSAAIELCIHAVEAINVLSVRPSFVDNYKIVLLSDFNHFPVDSSPVYELFHLHNSDCLPTTVFWNMNNHDCVDIHPSIDSSHSMVLSGYSSSHIHNLCNANTNSKKSMYRRISKIVSNKRFDCFSDYVDKMIQLF